MFALLAQLALFSIGSVSLLTALVGLIALLSILRRVRLSRIHNRKHSAARAAHQPMKAASLQTTQTQVSTHAAQSAPIILTARTMVSDHVTISIEPDETPFIQRKKLQRANLHRLISHLKAIETLNHKAG